MKVNKDLTLTYVAELPSLAYAVHKIRGGLSEYVNSEGSFVLELNLDEPETNKPRSSKVDKTKNQILFIQTLGQDVWATRIRLNIVYIANSEMIKTSAIKESSISAFL